MNQMPYRRMVVAVTEMNMGDELAKKMMLETEASLVVDCFTDAEGISELLKGFASSMSALNPKKQGM